MTTLYQLSEKPLVSVILANYNYEAYIKNALNSVFAQTYKHIELIIVDDGSTDNSREIIEQAVQGKDISVHTTFKPNGGLASAWNIAYEHASGEVICFLDSDDHWHENKVEVMVDFMRLCPGGAVYQHQLCTEWGLKRDLLASGDIFKKWLELKCVNIAKVDMGFFEPTSALVFPKAILDKVFPVPEHLARCTDGYLTRSSCVFGSVYSMPAILGYWRNHPENSGKDPKFTLIEYWIPDLMPTLNQFYAEQGVSLTFVFDPEAELQESGFFKQYFFQLPAVYSFDDKEPEFNNLRD